MARRILFLTHSCPLPQVSGERIRSYNLMRELAERGWHVSLFSLVWGPPPTDEDRRVLEGLCETVVLEPFRPASPLRYVRLLRDVVARRPFQASYFTSGSALARARRLLEADHFDVLLVSQLYTMGYVPTRLDRMTVFDSVNVEARRLAHMARSGPGLRSVAARLQIEAARRLETKVARDAQLVLAVSDEEAEYFEELAPGRVAVVPNGVDTQRLEPRATLPPDPSLLFVGSLNYSANVDAVLYLQREILGRVEHRDARVTVVGMDPPRAVYRAARRSRIPIEVTGFVETTRPYIEQSRALLVPLRQGGGTRLKILGALACGLPVVTTTVGGEGLGLRHEHDALVADEPASFARSIDRVLEDDDLCLELARNGRHTVERRFDWSGIGAMLDAELSSLQSGRRRFVAAST